MNTLGQAQETAARYGNSAVPTPPMETLTDVLGQNIAAIHELNGRLREAGRRLRGNIPEAVGPLSQKDTVAPCTLDLAFALRNSISESHELLNRIQQAL